MKSTSEKQKMKSKKSWEYVTETSKLKETTPLYVSFKGTFNKVEEISVGFWSSYRKLK